MGEVYKATDTRLDRTVAIKVLPEHVASDPDLKQRFEREARTVAALNHPHICTLHDIGTQDGIDFLVMEYLDGETLAQRLEKGALPLDQALQIAIEIADALDKAHRQGIVHRDLKPGNIMLTKAGAKLLDFGLAKLRKPGVVGTETFFAATTLSEPLTAQRLVFESHRSGPEGNLFVKSADGTGAVERLTESPTHQMPLTVSPDGEWIVFSEGINPGRLGMLPSNGDGSSEPLLESGFDETNAEISSDGRWIVYQSDASGRDEIYVQPFPNVDDGRWQISTGGGTQPLWAADGRELFYLAPGGGVMAVPVQTEPTFTAGNGDLLFDGSYFESGFGRTYDVAPDGQRFLMIAARDGQDGASASTDIIVIQHWLEELTERVPVN